MAPGGMCADCATGALHGGTPKGKVTSLYGLNTYIAEPTAGTELQGVIVILADAFGWELVNNRILADNFAEKGNFKVLLPDFFNGHWMSHDVLYSIETMLDNKAGLTARLPSGFRTAFSFVPFLFWNRATVAKPRIYNFFKDLRASTDMSIGAAGYCWGGKYTILMSHVEDKTDDGKPLIDAGYTAHPSMLVLPADIEPIKIPHSCALGSKDHALGAEEVAKYKQALEGKMDVELIEYEGAKHGFAVRGNPNDETEKRQGIEAEDQAIRFFTKYLAKSKL